MYCRCSLYVWCKDLHVFSEIQNEHVTGPSSLHLHDVEGHVSEKPVEPCNVNKVNNDWARLQCTTTREKCL